MTSFIRWRGLFTSSGAAASLVFLVGLIAMMGFQPARQPIVDDRAYLLYMAQAVARDEPVYQTTTFGYTPFASLISAGTIRVGAVFGMPTYLSPRFGAVVLVGLSGVLLYLIARRISGSHWVGIWAGVLNFGVQQMLVYHAANLEPKLLAQIFTLMLVVAIQHRRWLIAGAAGSAAAMCWQPTAAVSLVPLLVLAVNWRTHGARAFALWFAGLMLGALPALLYLTMTGQWSDFLAQGVFLKLAPETVQSGGNQVDWFEHIVLVNLNPSENWLPLLGILGIAAYIWSALIRPSATQGRGAVFAPASGGFFVLTVVWLVYLTLGDIGSFEVQGRGDLIYAHYLLAFWAAWGVLVIYQLGLWLLRRSAPVLMRVWSILLTIAVVGFALDHIGIYQPVFTLQQQQERVALLLLLRLEASDWLAVNLVEIYALTNLPSPFPILKSSASFETYIEQRLPRQCDTFCKLSKAIVTRIFLSGAPINCPV